MRGGDRQGLAAVVAALVLAACGSGEPEARPSGPSMATKPALQGSGRANQAPQLERVSLRPSSPKAGEPVRAIAQAHDPDGDRVQLTYRWTRNGRAVAASGAEFPASETRKGDLLSVTVTASDGEAEGEPRRIEARVGNQPPLVRSVRIDPAHDVRAGTNLSAVVDAEDPDGDSLRIEHVWSVNGRDVAGDAPTLATDALKRGDEVQLSVVARDGADQSRTMRSKPIRLGNATPVIRSKPEAMDADGVFRYTLRAEDQDGDRPLRYELVRGPQGMQLDPVSGEISWQPGESQSGRHEVELAVDDRHGGIARQRFELIVDALPAAPAD